MNQPLAYVHPSAKIASTVVIEPFTTIHKNVEISEGTWIGSNVTIMEGARIGKNCRIFPGAVISAIPQDLKFEGEDSLVVIGEGTTVRECVTINRGTKASGRTSIGKHCLIMAYAHVAHDCRVGNDTIFGNAGTLGGHVVIEDFATISAGSGVHQFCRVGQHAFIGGYSVVTQDALPYAKTVGNRARIFGLNTVGLVRRGFSREVVDKLRQAFRYLLQSKMNTGQALSHIAQDPRLQCDEVQYLLDFIRSSRRGVTLKRANRRADESAEE